MFSNLLVTLQFGLITAIIWPSRVDFAWPVAAALIILAGIAIGVWALRTNKPGNFNIRPEPKAGAQLVTGGAYRYVRHPMYLAVLVSMAGCCLLYLEPLKWWLLCALIIVLWLKARREESFMLAAHAGYAAYRARTKAIIPFIL